LTANVMAGDRETYQAAGMYDYLGKPFTSQELWSCLLKHIKPAGLANSPDPSFPGGREEDSETKLQTELKTDFVKSNQTRFSEIKIAIDNSDIKLAHRLVHSLKSNAALIGRKELQKVAMEVETALKDGRNLVTQAQMDTIKRELSAALDDLKPYLGGTPDQVSPDTAGFDADRIHELINRLEPLLKSGNPECLKMIDELKVIPGSYEITGLMEEYQFGAAAKLLPELRKDIDKKS